MRRISVLVCLVLLATRGNADKATCRCHGDPHCNSFDDFDLANMGGCTYVMTQDGCQNGVSDPGTDATFRVIVDQWNQDKDQQLSWVKGGIVDVLNLDVPLSISLQKNNVVLVNDEEKGKGDLPLTISGVGIRRTKRQVIVTLPNGVVVIWNGKTVLKVTVPDDFKGELCGLCGNYNDDPEDDLIMGDANGLCSDPDIVKGKTTLDSSTFALSWLYEFDDDMFCDTECTKVTSIPVCKEDAYNEAKQHCSVLTDPDGRFGACLAEVCHDHKVTQLVVDCIFDTCLADDDDSTFVCEQAEELVSICEEQYDIVMDDWRDADFCTGT